MSVICDTKTGLFDKLPPDRDTEEEHAMERQLKMRVLIAKPGLGGHDRRAKQIAQGLKE